MEICGYKYVMTSTQADEDAWKFYEKIGYHRIGGFVPPEQETEEWMYISCGNSELSHAYAFGGAEEQKRRLVGDGIVVQNGKVNLKRYEYKFCRMGKQ